MSESKFLADRFPYTVTDNTDCPAPLGLIYPLVGLAYSDRFFAGAFITANGVNYFKLLGDKSKGFFDEPEVTQEGYYWRTRNVRSNREYRKKIKLEIGHVPNHINYLQIGSREFDKLYDRAEDSKKFRNEEDIAAAVAANIVDREAIHKKLTFQTSIAASSMHMDFRENIKWKAKGLFDLMRDEGHVFREFFSPDWPYLKCKYSGRQLFCKDTPLSCIFWKHAAFDKTEDWKWADSYNDSYMKLAIGKRSKDIAKCLNKAAFSTIVPSRRLLLSVTGHFYKKSMLFVSRCKNGKFVFNQLEQITTVATLSSMNRGDNGSETVLRKFFSRDDTEKVPFSPVWYCDKEEQQELIEELKLREFVCYLDAGE